MTRNLLSPSKRDANLQKAHFAGKLTNFKINQGTGTVFFLSVRIK
jgi:hypothetical protein